MIFEACTRVLSMGDLNLVLPIVFSMTSTYVGNAQYFVSEVLH